MAKKLQILRGTTAQNDSYTGSIGELTMDTERVEVRIHDGTTQGGKTIGSGGGASFPMFYHAWADHLLDDMSWLRADGFSWQSGAVYQAAYQHLVDDIPTVPSITLENSDVCVRYTDGDVAGADYPYCWKSGNYTLYTMSETPSIGEWTLLDATEPTNIFAEIIATGTAMPSPETETVNGVAISYYLADDGHKICMPDQESNVAAIYAATGVAWYYIIDTTNQRFKLPRTQFGFTGLRDGVGNYVEAGVPNITGDIIPTSAYSGVVATGAFYGTERSASTITNGGAGSAAGNRTIVGMSASRSSSVYGNSTTVQPPATEMYLYFYVGNFEQSAIEQTAGLNAELFNQKADLNLANSAPTSQFAQLLLNAGIDTVIERQEPTADNNYTWYRKYKSGWVEQGGQFTSTIGTSDTAWSTNLLVPMTDNQYFVSVCAFGYAGHNTINPEGQTSTVLKGYATSNVSSTKTILWYVCGMAA